MAIYTVYACSNGDYEIVDRFTDRDEAYECADDYSQYCDAALVREEWA